MKQFLAIMVLLALGLVQTQSIFADDSSSESSDSSSVESTDEDRSDDSDSDSNDDNSQKKEKRSFETHPVKMNMGSGKIMGERGSGKLMGSGNMLKNNTELKATKEELKALREQKKSEIEENLKQAAENRKNFREENKEAIQKAASSLTEEQKAELESMRKAFQTELDTLKEKLKAASSDEEKDSIREEIKTLAESHYQDLKTLFGEDSPMAEIIAQREDIFQENKALREENRETRREFLEVKKEKVQKYRAAFVTKLGNTIDSLPAEKLQTIDERITTMIEKTKNDTTMSDSQKETLLSALEAIKEIIEEKIEGDDVESDVLEVVESLLTE